MTAKMFIAGAWDFVTYGSCTLDFSDSAGAHSITPFTSGQYEHGDLCVLAGVASPVLSSLAVALEIAMNAASPTKVYTVDFVDNRYTIAVNAGTVFLAPNGLMNKLLGLGLNLAGTSITSSYDPWFCMTPAKAGPTNYKPPVKLAGATKETVSDDGDPYRLRPTAIPRLCSWEHHFEPKAAVDLDYHGSGTGYTWEGLWSDYGLAQMPIGVYIETSAGDVERMAVSLRTPEYDETEYSRMRPADDSRFKIVVMAKLWRASGTDAWARTFNA